jgi:hypothetical protein
VYIAVMEKWWLPMRLFFGLPLALFILLTIFEPQPRPSTKKMLRAFMVAWGTVFAFIWVTFVCKALL